MRLLIKALSILIFFTSSTAISQSGGLDEYSNGNYDSDEALEQATPTDNVNELGNSNGNGNYSLGNENGSNYPQNQNEGNFNINNGGNNYGNSLFNDDEGNEYSNIPKAPSALGNDNGMLNNTQSKANQVNSSPQQVQSQTISNPNQEVNAETLMDELDQPDAEANDQNNLNQVNDTPQVELVDADNDLVVLDEPEGPLAPPLPPPNEFSGAPPVPGSMRQMAEGEAPELYMVEHGDTLFDICDQLLDEPTYWPKLWAMNPAIKNPHFIYPGVALKFYPGDDESPPYLQVVSEEDIIPIDKGDLDESELIAELVKLPTEAFQDNVIEVIGPDGVRDELAEGSFETAGKFFEGSDIVVRVPMFLYSSEKEPLAFVIGGRNGEHTVIDGRKVLVESEGSLSGGTTYTILRPHGEVENPETGETAGYKYSFIANVTMGGSVGDEIYVGTVKDTRLSVFPNDIIVSYISTVRTLPQGSDVGGLATANANIVGFEYNEQIMGGEGQMALIDQGNGDGVSVGMYLPIYSSPSNGNNFQNDLPVDYKQIGVIRVIDATDAGAIGFIVKNSMEFRVGDRAGKG
jgi:hypothetical protein